MSEELITKILAPASNHRACSCCIREEKNESGCLIRSKANLHRATTSCRRRLHIEAGWKPDILWALYSRDVHFSIKAISMLHGKHVHGKHVHPAVLLHCEESDKLQLCTEARMEGLREGAASGVTPFNTPPLTGMQHLV